jgi:hypothetical protein
MRLAVHDRGFPMDSWICQTFAASPAEPGASLPRSHRRCLNFQEIGRPDASGRVAHGVGFQYPKGFSAPGIAGLKEKEL